MAYAYIGTSGFYYSNWVPSFYPATVKKVDMLTYYSRRLSSVEINTTFYSEPRPTSTKRWHADVPPKFALTFKMPQKITHVQNLRFEETDLTQFIDSLELFASTKPQHVILIQLPASYTMDLVSLDFLLSRLPSTFRYAIELRHPSWFYTKTYELLKQYNIALVMADSPRKMNGEHLWPRANIETADFFYMRLHGSIELYTSNYTPQELEVFRKVIANKLQKNKDI
jgi:uncharacterized protein YecE (DUF72 family)